MILTVTLNVSLDRYYELDQLNIGEVNRAKSCKYAAGGKGINVARVAHLAGEKVCATGFVGGYIGEYIIHNLKETGIDSDFVIVKGESRICMNLYDGEKKEHTEILEPGLQVTRKDQDHMIETYKKLLKDSSIVVISGSIPQGTQPNIYASFILLAQESKIPVLLDSSGELLIDAMKMLPTLIKPNKDEIAQIIGEVPKTELEYLEAGSKILRTGITYVVISMGKEGSLFFCEEGIYQAIVPELEVVNTVGCGDSMMAGLAIGLKRGMPVDEMLRYASAISASNALRKETGFFIREDFERIYPQIIIKKINKKDRRI